MNNRELAHKIWEQFGKGLKPGSESIKFSKNSCILLANFILEHFVSKESIVDTYHHIDHTPEGFMKEIRNSYFSGARQHQGKNKND